MGDADLTESVCASVRSAYERNAPIEVVGGGSRRDFGRAPIGEPLSLAGHCGIIGYEPGEYVITVRSGTPIADIEAAVAAHGQMLLAELPRADQRSTIGGAVALGLTGPGRPYRGSLRDAVLGVRVVTGTGQLLRFGGQVLKNVAGFDVSRLMVGAYGTLGVLLDVTLRLAPRPEEEAVRILHCDWPAACSRLLHWSGRLPLSGASYYGDHLRVRLSGDGALVARAAAQIGGDAAPIGEFHALRDLRLARLQTPAVALWRVLVPPATPLGPAESIIDWGGAQRFWATAEAAATVRQFASDRGGQAVWLKGPDRGGDVWPVSSIATLALLGRLKGALDPHHVLNRGRLFPAW